MKVTPILYKLIKTFHEAFVNTMTVIICGTQTRQDRISGHKQLMFPILIIFILFVVLLTQISLKVRPTNFYSETIITTKLRLQMLKIRKIVSVTMVRILFARNRDKNKLSPLRVRITNAM